MKSISSISIRKRLIIYFIVAILIPTAIVTLTVYHKSKGVIEKKIDETNQKNVETISEVVEKRVESIYDISTLITYNPRLIDILSSENDCSAISIVNEITELETIINGYYLFGQSYTDSNYMFPRIYMVGREEYNQYKISDRILDIGQINNTDWYKNLSKSSFSIAGKDQMKILNGTVDTIKVVRRLYRTDNPFNPFAALLTIDIDETYFTELLERLNLSKGCASYIINEDGIVIIGNPLEDSSYIHDFMRSNMKNTNDFHSKIIDIDGKKMLISAKNIHKINWNIVTVSPLNELNKELINLNKIIIMVVLICIVIAGIAAILLSNDFSKPIEKLVESMENVDHDNLQIELDYKREDEFGFLIEHYKSMMERIRDLIDKLYISEIRKNKAELKTKEAEMEALMAQINPHFLYNSLDSINWLALKYGAEDISTMVKSLSHIFRYSLNGNSVITFEEEKKQVESYLRLQQTRFKKMLEYYIEFDPEIKNCRTVKLILQPIVENAIVHGFRNSENPGLICMIGRLLEEDKIELRISDNGCGGDIGKMNRMLREQEEGEAGSEGGLSIGIRNVDKRLKNFFGEGFGLEFSSNKEGGVTAILRLRAIRNRED